MVPELGHARQDRDPAVELELHRLKYQKFSQALRSIPFTGLQRVQGCLSVHVGPCPYLQSRSLGPAFPPFPDVEQSYRSKVRDACDKRDA